MSDLNVGPDNDPTVWDVPQTGSVYPRALKHLDARQRAHAERLNEREDRFSHLLARSTTGELRGDRLHTGSGLTDDERCELIRLAPEAERTYRQEQAESLVELRSLLGSADPLRTIALSSYFQVFSTPGHYFEPAAHSSEAIVEIIAGLLLTQPAPPDGTAPSSDLISEATALARSILDLAVDANIAAAAGDDPAAALRSTALIHWLHVRGDAYEEHARQLTHRIFDPLDQQMVATFGFTIHEFYEIADAAMALLVDRVNESGRRMADKLYEIGFTPGVWDEAALEVVERSIAELADALVFRADDLRRDAVPAATAENVIKRLSVGVGTLERRVYSSPFERSPLTRTPFVSHNERYALPVPGHLVRSPHELFEHALLARYPKFTKHRADMLDELCVELIASSLPGSDAATNAFYTFDNGDGVERFETDGIVVFENYCLVVEGKAGGRLSDAALRGDMTRLGRDLGKGLESAWKQCARVQRYLESANQVTFDTEAGDRLLEIDMSSIDQIVHITPMLHSLGVYAHQIPALQRANLFAANNTSPWPVLVTDLMVIHELTATPAEFLHYLRWRSALPIGDGVVATDELDIFGSYLFGEVGRSDIPPNAVLAFANSTSDFDDYYSGKRGDTDPVQAPRRVLGDFLETHLLDLAERRPRKWLSQSFTVLDLSLAEAAQVTGWLESVGPRDLAQRDWVATQISGTVVALARSEVPIATVALGLGRPPRAARRLLIARMENGRPRIVSARTLR